MHLRVNILCTICTEFLYIVGAGDDFIPLNTPQQSGSVRGVECGEDTGERRPVTKWYRSPAKRPRAQQKPDQPTTSKSPPAKSGLKTAKGNKQHCIDTCTFSQYTLRTQNHIQCYSAYQISVYECRGKYVRTEHVYVCTYMHIRMYFYSIYTHNSMYRVITHYIICTEFIYAHS